MRDQQRRLQSSVPSNQENGAGNKFGPTSSNSSGSGYDVSPLSTNSSASPQERPSTLPLHGRLVIVSIT